METAVQRLGAQSTKRGGPVRGPGGPRDDKVPINASNGEFVVQAPAVARVGVDFMHKLNALGGKAPAKKAVKGGAIRKMAYGGLVGDDDPLRRRDVQTSPDQIPGGVGQPSPGNGNSIDSSELGRNVGNALSALPGVAPLLGAAGALSTASRAGAAGAGAVRALAASPTVQAAAPYVVPALGIGAVGAAASRDDPAAAAVATTPVARAAAPATIPGVIQPAPQLPAAGIGTGTDVGYGATRYDTTGANGRPGSPLFTNLPATDASNTALVARGAPTAQNLGALDRLAGRYAAEQGGAAQAQLNKEQYDREVADAQAINANTYAVNAPAGALRRLRAVADTAAVRAGTANLGANQANAAARLALDAQRQGLEAPGVAADSVVKQLGATSARQLMAMQAEYADPKTTPARRAVLEDNIRAAQGKYPKDLPTRWTAVSLGTDEMGRNLGQVAINNDTGEIKSPQTTALPKVTSQADFDKLAKGAKYIGADGRTFQKP